MLTDSIPHPQLLPSKKQSPKLNSKNSSESLSYLFSSLISGYLSMELNIHFLSSDYSFTRFQLILVRTSFLLMPSYWNFFLSSRIVMISNRIVNMLSLTITEIWGLFTLNTNIWLIPFKWQFSTWELKFEWEFRATQLVVYTKMNLIFYCLQLTWI